MKFIYSLTCEDYISYERFKIKKNEVAVFSYIVFFIFLAIGIYNAVADKTFDTLIIAAVIIAVELSSSVYKVKVAAEKRAKSYISLDSSYLGEKEIIIDDKAVEIKYIPKENQAAVVAVYPYSIISVIYETAGYYYISVSDGVKILPKRVIPAEFYERVTNLLNKNSNHLFIK